MTTSVGTEDTLEELLEDLIRLDYDALDAYEAAIDRLAEESHRSALGEFAEDHRRHTRELGEILSAMGRTPPQKGDAKRFLTQGKVALGGLVGDKAVLRAMRTNEDDTNTAYERAAGFRDVPAATREVLERARDDERRHRAWIVSTLESS